MKGGGGERGSGKKVCVYIHRNSGGDEGIKPFFFSRREYSYGRGRAKGLLFFLGLCALLMRERERERERSIRPDIVLLRRPD